jgi:hypothetical protein
MNNGNELKVVACAVGLSLLSGISFVNAAWVNATGNLSGLPTECGDIQSIWAVPNVNEVVIGVSGNGLYATTDGGTTWAEISSQSSNPITIRLTQMTFDSDNPSTWYVGGIYHTPGIFKTTDAGATWKAVSPNAGDGFAVDFSDPQRQTLLQTGHESGGTLYKSTNGGQSWTNIGGPGGGNSFVPYILNAQTYLMSLYNAAGIFRSTNAGSSWSQVSSLAPTTHMLETSAGDLYYVGYSGGNKIARGSSDGSTWTILNTSFAPAGMPLIEIPGGKIAILTTTGIAISSDKGATWTIGCRNVPSQITGATYFGGPSMGLAYNAVAGAFYAYYWTCVFTNAAIHADQVWRFDTLIQAGTSVVMPSKRFESAATASRNSAAMFDIAGRIRRVANRHGSAFRKTEVCIVRTRDGVTTKMVHDD